MLIELIMASVIYVGSGNGNSVQSQQFYDRLLTAPTGTREAAYNALISGLNDSGVSTLLDFLYVFAAADYMSASINLISGASYAATVNQVGPYLADRYIGASNILDFGFNPSVATKFSRNSASLFAWNLNTTAIPGYMIGSQTDESHISPYNNNVSNHTLWAINSASEVDSGAIVSDASGFWLVNRTASTVSSIWRNNSQIATSSVASINPTNASMRASSNAHIAAVGAGSGLTTQLMSALYNSLSQYLQTVGAI